MAEEIKTVGVIGTGVIGSSWATLFLSKGLKVIMQDPAPGSKERFIDFLDDAWPALEKIGLGEGVSKTNFEFIDDILPRLSEVDFVQEVSGCCWSDTASLILNQVAEHLQNGPERVELKTKLIGKIDANTRPGVVIASSSSGLPSSQFLADCKQDPDRVLIGHPFNPPHIVPLVEVVPHPQTRRDAIDTALNFYCKLGKHPIEVTAETPGFVANRLQAAINNEAYSLISRGIVSAQDLDTAVTMGIGLRWALNGPIVTNSLGGGGGKDGFTQRLERLGPGIRAWEQDVAGHRFDWSGDALVSLNNNVGDYLDQMNVQKVTAERDEALLEIIALKKKLSARS